MQVQSLGQEDSPEEGMATHSSILAWRIPWTEEPGRLWSTGLQRVRHDWSNLACRHIKGISIDNQSNSSKVHLNYTTAKLSVKLFSTTTLRFRLFIVSGRRWGIRIRLNYNLIEIFFQPWYHNEIPKLTKY